MTEQLTYNPPRPPAGATAHRDLAFVAIGHERQKLDLYLPEQGMVASPTRRYPN